MAALLDLARLFLGASLLLFAAYTDWLWRRAPNVLWMLMAGAGAVLLGVQAALDWASFQAAWPYLAAVPVFIGVMYALWWFGLIAGGADAKALMALAILLPFPVALTDAVPAWTSPMPGAFVVLGNSLLLFLLIPLSFLAWNLAHGHARLPHAFLGLKRPARLVMRGHQWPMEVVDESGARRTKFFASRMSDAEVDENFARIQALGDEKVWVSPKVPFMLPLAGGFVATFVVGDMLFRVLETVLP